MTRPDARPDRAMLPGLLRSIACASGGGPGGTADLVELDLRRALEDLEPARTADDLRAPVRLQSLRDFLA